MVIIMMMIMVMIIIIAYGPLGDVNDDGSGILILSVIRYFETETRDARRR